MPSATHREDITASTADDLLVAWEVAALLRVTTAWVYAETRRGALPHVRLGRYVRYRRGTLIEWLAEQERASARSDVLSAAR